MWSNSGYFLQLDSNGRKNYKAKLTLSDNATLPDPYLLEQASWSNELNKLPEITWGDVYNYLINTTSEYTKEKLKAHKSLEAYNFFVCGHVQDVFYNDISDESNLCYMKSKVSLSCTVLKTF